MMPTTFPAHMIPVELPHKLAVVGPKDLLAPDAPGPLEALILQDGFHIRIAVTEKDIENLHKNPHLHLIVNAQRLPQFWIGTEEEALNNYGTDA